jgi:hypothetical protein
VKAVLLSAVMLLAILIGVYYGSFYIMPSITIINNSGVTIETGKVRLPRSNLDFGSIENGQKNTLHYSLTQADGEYEYKFIFSDDVSISGSCGYLTQNEINKRVSITVTTNKVVCDLRI